MSKNRQSFFRHHSLLNSFFGFTLIFLVGTACAPITPPPGIPSPISLPSSSSSSSRSSTPPSMPSLPSKPSSSSSSSPSSQQANPPSAATKGKSENNSSTNGGDSGDGDEDGVVDPLAGQGENSPDSDNKELSWEKTQSSPSSSQWETSNDLPAKSKAAQSAGDSQSASTSKITRDQSKLNKKLGDFDQEILSERQALKDNENPDSQSVGTKAPQVALDTTNERDKPGGTGPNSTGGFGGPERSIPTPARGKNIPDDIPDARDDDIIARQLREAATDEQDPTLKERLWEEYKRYKRG